MIIKHLEQKNQTLKNIKFNGRTVKAILNGIANAGSGNIDFSKSTIQVILTRDNKPHVICQQNLKILGLASSIGTLEQLAFASTMDAGQQLVAGQTAIVCFTIPFLGVIDLHGDDEIYIEIQNSEGLFTDANLEAASFLEVKPLKCYGVEKFIPRIRALVVQANEASNQYMLSDNLIRCVLLNFDKSDFKTNVINNVVFSSDRLDENYTYQDLIAKKLRMAGKQLLPHGDADISVDFQQDQSFVLTDAHEEYDGVSLDIQFNSPNVTASNNYIVAWNYDTDWTILTKAAAAESKHAKITQDKITAATTNGKK
jgi:hypothetical protein